ncbi:hypothetical protein JFN87_03055 [Streptomyces bomunensis]|uniref:Transketolase N-terminal domain-containing protein n=2 Tax=Streptomyces montanisoli TaxID=2798581 RepID=A0A940MD37_9ACTN|nr:hypothetical protein [Streptomyces montanisoli]
MVRDGRSKVVRDHRAGTVRSVDAERPAVLSCQVAAAQRVGNLVVVVDRNGGQNDGLVADVSPQPRLAARFAAFGFDVAEADGHDVLALRALLACDRSDRDRPLAIIADTVKGKGLRPVEGKAPSHYVTIDAARAASWKRTVR